MSQEIEAKLTIKDDGSLVIQNFSNNVKRAMSDVEGTTTKAVSSFQKLKDSWALMSAGIASGMYIFSQIRSFVEPCITAFMEQEAATKKLEVAMKNFGDYTENSIKGLSDFASEMQNTTRFADETILGIMALLKSFGMNNEVMKETVKVAADLSEGLGIDLEAAARLLGKAFVGETGTLSRYGIVIDETIPKVERFDAVMKQLQERFGGQAQASLETTTGKWQWFKNQLGEIAEHIGGTLLGAVVGLTNAVQNQGEKLGKYRVDYMAFGDTLVEIKVPIENVKDAVEAEAEQWAIVTQALKNYVPPSDKVIEANRKIMDSIELLNAQIQAVRMTEVDKKLLQLKVEEQAALTKAEQEGIDKRLVLKEYAKKRELILEEDKWKTILATSLSEGERLHQQEVYLNDQIVEAKKTGYEKTVESYASMINDETRMNEEFLQSQIQFVNEELREIERLHNSDLAMSAEANSKATALFKERWDVERDVLTTIQEFKKNTFQLERDAVDQHYQQLLKYAKEHGMNLKAIYEAWEIEKQKIRERELLEIGNFWDGVKVWLDRNERDQQTWAKSSYAIMEGIFGKSGAFSNLVSGFFQDVFHGHLKSAEDYFNAFKESLIKIFSDAIAQTESA